MIISNEVFKSICVFDDDTCKDIAIILNSRLNNVLLTGFVLSYFFVSGYSKAINLTGNLLLCKAMF